MSQLTVRWSVLLTGRVVVRRAHQAVAELAPGSVVGEVALNSRRVRNADVATVERSELLVVPFDRLAGPLQDHPELRVALDVKVSVPEPRSTIGEWGTATQT